MANDVLNRVTVTGPADQIATDSGSAGDHHLPREIPRDDQGAGNLTRHADREVSGTRSQIQDDVTVPDVRQPASEALPRPVPAQRHDVVGQVVAWRDTSEQSSHVASLG